MSPAHRRWTLTPGLDRSEGGRSAGADIKSAQRILGHSKASHTLDIYADFVPDRVDAAMERLEAAIEEA